MKKTWLVALAGVTAIALAIGAVACSSSNNNSTKTPQSTAQPTSMASETPGTTPSASGTPLASGTVTGPISVTLNAMGGSGVTGTATLNNGSAAGATQVVVTIDGGLTAGPHQNHIHTGQCEAQGNVQDALTPLQAAADGTATGTTPAVPEPLSNFTGGHNYVAVHATDGTVVACGNIPTN